MSKHVRIKEIFGLEHYKVKKQLVNKENTNLFLNFCVVQSHFVDSLWYNDQENLLFCGRKRQAPVACWENLALARSQGLFYSFPGIEKFTAKIKFGLGINYLFYEIFVVLEAGAKSPLPPVIGQPQRMGFLWRLNF